ncbi:hypothetical protein [Paracoccus liaowanqingii]|uniref:hypothetical protein n=1 Tax=Paracoccus liaowanqingii TaxID=2560053 RepID=UPI00159BBE87|nr:hypothetical protein [Paracoccus liaowanqingii]
MTLHHGEIAVVLRPTLRAAMTLEQLARHAAKDRRVRHGDNPSHPAGCCDG